jgi:hypothetical protein
MDIWLFQVLSNPQMIKVLVFCLCLVVTSGGQTIEKSPAVPISGCKLLPLDSSKATLVKQENKIRPIPLFS